MFLRRNNKILQPIVTNFTTFSNLLSSFVSVSFDAHFIKWLTSKIMFVLYGYISKMQFFSTDSVNNLYKHIRRYIPANPKLFSVFVSLLIYITSGDKWAFQFLNQSLRSNLIIIVHVNGVLLKIRNDSI